MGYKDPEVRKAYNRDQMRERRSSAAPSSVTRNTPIEWRASTAQDIKEIVAEQLNRLLNSDIDVAVQSRAVASLASVAIKLIETADLERRINELEGVISPKPKKDATIKAVSEP